MDKLQTNSNHLENLSLHDFIQPRGRTIEERALAFSETIASYSQPGEEVWARPIAGSADAIVQIDSRAGLQDEIMLGSNNYLGFANDAYIKQRVCELIGEFGTGAGGPPLLNGTLAIHKRLEQALADFKGYEDAMLFTSGYQANIGWIEGLLRESDFLVYDEQSHASVYDGICLAKARRRVKSFRFRHNDVEHLQTILARIQDVRKPGACVAVTVEGVYSMDGDLAPLNEVMELCQQYDARLVLDDAHGTGVMGEGGRGTSEFFELSRKPFLAMGTFSKAFGTVGGFVLGSKPMIDYLRFYARSYMFSAHLPPTVVATVLAGLERLKLHPKLVNQLHDNVRYLCAGLKKLGLDVASQSAIISVKVKPGVSSRQVATEFHRQGVFLNCIEYPAVARADERLRISVMATHSRAQLDRAIAAFVRVNELLPFIDGPAHAS